MYIRKRKVPHSQSVRQIGDPVKPTKFRNQVLVVTSLPKEMIVREYMNGNINSIYQANITIGLGNGKARAFYRPKGKGRLIECEKVPGLKNIWTDKRG